MTFPLIKYTQLTKEKFDEYPSWAQYYEPNDVNILESLGLNKMEVTNALKSVNWSDEYWFQIPRNAPVGVFQFEHRKANIKNRSGRLFKGYLIGDGYAIGIFGKTKEWIINQNLPDRLNEKIDDIKEDLGMRGDEDIFPLFIDVPSEKIFVQFERPVD